MERLQANQISDQEDSRNILFYGLLVYSFIYYSQIGSRIPVLGKIRIELLVGIFNLCIYILYYFQGRIDTQKNPLNKYCFLFLAIIVITIPFALNKTIALNDFVLVFKSFTIFLIITGGITSHKQLKIFIYLYLILICWLYIEPFVLSLRGMGFRYNNHMMRLFGVTGAFAHPNSLGSIASSGFPFFYYLFLLTDKLKLKLFYIALIIIGIRVVMLTQSRTAFVSVAAFAFFVWIYSKKKIGMAVFFIICMIVTWQFASEETKSRFETLGNATEVITTDNVDDAVLEHGSMAARWRLIHRSFSIFLENPIIGVGIGNFVVASYRKYDKWFPTHNLYTQILAELGIIGFLLFALIILTTTRNLNKARAILKEISEEETFLDYMAMAVKIFLFMRLVVGLFGHDLYYNYWWLSGGLSIVILTICSKKKEQYQKENKLTS